MSTWELTSCADLNTSASKSPQDVFLCTSQCLGPCVVSPLLSLLREGQIESGLITTSQSVGLTPRATGEIEANASEWYWMCNNSGMGE